MKVLFDHCVRQDAIRGQYGLGFFWQKYRPRPERTDWKQKEIDCLAGVADLCREGKIIPYSTIELEAEYLRAAKLPCQKYEDLLGDIKFEMAQCPFIRSKWGLSMEQHLDREQVIKFCKCFFLSPSMERIERFIAGMRENPANTLSPFEEKCLRRVNIFKKICHGMDEKHYPDALHLWTAEENGLNAFLTTDKKFRNIMDRQNVQLKCATLFPSDLVIGPSTNIQSVT